MRSVKRYTYISVIHLSSFEIEEQLDALVLWVKGLCTWDVTGIISTLAYSKHTKFPTIVFGFQISIKDRVGLGNTVSRRCAMAIKQFGTEISLPKLRHAQLPSGRSVEPQGYLDSIESLE